MSVGGVLSLDLATVLGYAVGRLPPLPITQLEAAATKPPQPHSGFHRIAQPNTPVGPFLSAYADWLDAMLAEHKPGGLIFEAPILPAKTSLDTVRKLVGLAGVTQMLAHETGITWIREAQPSSVKLHICGSGAPGKTGVQRAIMERGWEFATDDQADALALWDYAVHLAYRERAAG